MCRHRHRHRHRRRRRRRRCRCCCCCCCRRCWFLERLLAECEFYITNSFFCLHGVIVVEYTPDRAVETTIYLYDLF